MESKSARETTERDFPQEKKVPKEKGGSDTKSGFLSIACRNNFPWGTRKKQNPTFSTFFLKYNQDGGKSSLAGNQR